LHGVEKEKPKLLFQEPLGKVGSQGGVTLLGEKEEKKTALDAGC